MLVQSRFGRAGTTLELKTAESTMPRSTLGTAEPFAFANLPMTNQLQPSSGASDFSAVPYTGATPLFPLPLAPFEYYYLQDDSPDYPTIFAAVLRFVGPLDHAAFTQAMQLVVARHPLLTARIDEPPNAWPRWVPGPEFKLDWQQEPHPATADGWLSAAEPFDLRREAGFRAAVCELRDCAELRMQVHHACCDGISAQIIVRDLLLAYDHLAAGKAGSPTLPPVDPERLRVRDEFGMAGYRTTLRDLWNMLVVWGTWLFRPAAEVAARGQSDKAGRVATGHDPHDAVSYAVAELNAEETARLAKQGKQQGVTVNDLVLCDLFLAIEAWNRAHSRGSRGNLRILAPTNLRLEADAVMPAANVLGFALLTRGRAALADPAKLLQGIHAEMDAIKKWRLGLYFVAGVRIACRWPKLLRWCLRRRHSFATAVFSNMAAVFGNLGFPQRNGHVVVGGAELVWMASVPPIRPGTRVALAAVTYGGVLHLHLRGDERYLSRDDAQTLVDDLAGRLRSSAI